jgi:HD-GYP domain-containing protein (c-di-GMP phosphodiesterase class II)
MTPIEHVVNGTAALIAGAAVTAAIGYLPWRVRDAYKQTFIALARAVESREPYLLGHAERTARYVVLMARWCGMTPWATRHLEYAALMHGIGKVSVPYGLLNNPDPLYNGPSSITSTDRFVMRDYVRVGAAIMDAVPALRPAADIARYHHEYYDGSGYPFGRNGNGIPFGAQMLCVASEYVAMTTPRLYRSGVMLMPEQAVAHLVRYAGRRYHWGAVYLFLLAKSVEDSWLKTCIRVRRWYGTGSAVLPRRVL